MLVVLDVVVDIDLDRLDGNKAVGLSRQGLEGRPIQLLEGLPAVAGQLLERLVVEFDQQAGDAAVELGQREEGVVAQPGQDPALDDLDGDLGFGLVLGLVGPCRHHCDPVVVGQLLVAGVDLRVITAGLAHSAAQVVRDEQLGHAAEELEGPDMAFEPVRQ